MLILEVKYRMAYLLRPVFLILMVLLCENIKGNNALGGEIGYKYIGNDKYLITAKIYRYCKGGTMNTPVFYVYPSGSCSYDRIYSFQRISITDITPRCDTASAPCTPSNTSVSKEGIEMHVYTDTMDLHKSPYSNYLTANCCEFTIFMRSPTYRAYILTTGAYSQYMTVFCNINICNLRKCKNKVNNSPDWEEESTLQLYNLCCNQTFNSVGTIDYLDNDSLKFKLVSPITDVPNTPFSYTTPFSYQYPLTPYCNPPTTIKCTPNIKTDPPRGFSFDTTNGSFIFCPTNCYEAGPLVGELIEYRHDSTGKPVIVGKLHREQIARVMDNCGYNKSPIIKGPNSKSIPEVCEGDSMGFSIYATDETFTPYSTVPDTVELYLKQTDFSNQYNFKILNPKDREKEGYFKITPKKGDARITPYTFYFVANDHHCPIPRIQTKTFKIKVKATSDSILPIKFTRNDCGGFNIATSDLGYNNVHFQFTFHNLDSNLSYTGYSYSLNTNSYPGWAGIGDLKTGIYKIMVTASSPDFCFKTQFFYDTIYSTTSIRLPKDTTICYGQSLTIKPALINSKKPVHYFWSINDKQNPKDTFPFLAINNIKTKQKIGLYIYDSLGCAFGYYNYTYLTNISIFPRKIPKLGKDTSVCPQKSIILSPGKFTKANYLWSTGDSTPTIIAKDSGYYSILLTDSNHCSERDTMKLSNKLIPEIQISKLNTFCQSGNTIKLDSFVKLKNKIATGEGFNYNYYSFNGNSTSKQLDSIKTKPGNIFMQNNKYGNWEIHASGIFNTCFVQDSFAIILSPNPVASFTTIPAGIANNDSVFSITNKSSIADLSHLKYLWNFGQNANDTSTLTNPVIRYPLKNATYKISLLVNSNEGCSNSTSKNVQVTVVVSVNKILAKNGFRLNDNLVLLGENIQSIVLKLYDSQGRLLFENTKNEGLPKETTFAPGIYFYQIQITKQNGEGLSVRGKITINSN